MFNFSNQKQVFKFVVLVIFLIVMIDYNFFNQWSQWTDWTTLHLRKDLPPTVSVNLTVLPPAGYLVWNDHCRMPDVNPFTPEAMTEIVKLNYTLCSDQPTLTYIAYDINLRVYVLHIDEEAKEKLIDDDDEIACCYQMIFRSGSEGFVDDEFELASCVTFQEGDVVPPHINGVIVKCNSLKDDKEIQRDAYFFVPEKSEVRQRLAFFKKRAWKDKERPVSVLLWGMDSMSRFNLRRTMPETTAQLVNDSWFELSGYNKIDENTFPNIMALLSGYSLTTAYDRCGLPTEGGLDNCNIIWDLYRKYGYVTGHAEDESWMSTFNYVMRGFKKVPVDYYQRPFMMAIEKTLEKGVLLRMGYCLGRRHAAEYVYDFALELGTRYRGEPYFGLVWTNTFTHNGFDGATAMDTRIVRYIEQMKQRGILDDSIVIFFSDHGARFGGLRQLKEGFLEERLPFVFIWLPFWFRKRHPDFVQALKLNQYRLTNPYDIHMTLKHILELTGRTGKLPQAVDCPNCQSIFVPVPEQRSCKDIAIDDHWCTCVPYQNVETESTEILNGVNSVLDHLNLYLKNGKFSPPCIQLQLKTVDEAQIKGNLEPERNNSDTSIFRIRFTVNSTDSNAKFEASVNYSKTLQTYEIINRVSRLDSYDKGSTCISDRSAKIYCICEEEESTTNPV